jgi:NADH-quinone oxidoreductase subunit F
VTASSNTVLLAPATSAAAWNAQNPAPEDLATYRARGGYEGFVTAAERAREDGGGAFLVDLVEAAGLRGRGGASFPTARKWRIAAEHAANHAEGAVVVANGGEHEPGSGKDAWLVEHRPHAVLEGMLLCAMATGARHAWLYLISDMAGPLAAAESALEELRAAGLVGDGAPWPCDVAVFRAPTTYVAGEETAAIDAIEGGPGKPRKKPPYPGEAGLHGRPTTVNNVETLAHVPWILRHGADAYAALGTEHSKGTMLFTLPGVVRNPGIHEAPFGVTYRELIESERYGGGVVDGRAVRAVLPATSSAFLGPEHLDRPICYHGLREVGSSPGCGGIHLLLQGDDVVEKVLTIAKFFMKEQCGQCPPCRMETNQFVHVLEAVQAGKGPGYAEKIGKLVAFARGKGFCSLIEMAAAPVVSALAVFQDEFAAAAGDAPTNAAD